jgi:hypothetical protein
MTPQLVRELSTDLFLQACEQVDAHRRAVSNARS